MSVCLDVGPPPLLNLVGFPLDSEQCEMATSGPPPPPLLLLLLLLQLLIIDKKNNTLKKKLVEFFGLFANICTHREVQWFPIWGIDDITPYQED